MPWISDRRGGGGAEIERSPGPLHLGGPCCSPAVHGRNGWTGVAAGGGLRRPGLALSLPPSSGSLRLYRVRNSKECYRWVCVEDTVYLYCWGCDSTFNSRLTYSYTWRVTYLTFNTLVFKMDALKKLGLYLKRKSSCPQLFSLVTVILMKVWFSNFTEFIPPRAQKNMQFPTNKQKTRRIKLSQFYR